HGRQPPDSHTQHPWATQPYEWLDQPVQQRKARLTAEERRRIVADVIDDALDGVPAPAYRSGLLAATPDLPDDPTPDQLHAWNELALLVRDPEFRAALRRLAVYSARTAPGTPTPDGRSAADTGAASGSPP
ncbi:hypothetical protein ACH4YO_40265, partial [Streptomyces noursei]